MRLAPPARPGHWWPASEASLRERVQDLDERLASALWQGSPVAELVHARAWAVEQAVLEAWRAVVGGASAPASPAGAEAPPAPSVPDTALALVAVGGFGRGESFPRSDLDLLVLVAHEDVARRHRAPIESFFARLWDEGLKPGHSVRTPAQCGEAAADLTVATALMEARLLDGEPALFEAMRAAIAPDRVWPPATYAAAKLAEQAARHARHDDTAHNLEPDLKEGPGGLRDSQLPVWIAQRALGARDLDELAAGGLLSAAEQAALRAARDTLWRTRFGLHLVAPRAEERLLFEHQRELARRFGHADEHAQNLAVEQFMQGWYRAADAVDRIGERIVQRVEARRVPPPARVLDADFVARGALLDLADPARLEREPVLLLGAFARLVEDPALRGFDPRLLAQLDEALPRLDRWLGSSDEAGMAFVAILRRRGDVARALGLMSRYGVLARLVPPFARVAGRMQHDLFHVYTVDQHTLKVLRFVDRFDHDAETYPLAHALLSRVRKRELLYLAALFHDIAKGRGGDHSVLGEADARSFGSRLGLAASDVELVAWLVREHLAMSVTAQKQDISDPEVVRRFATRVGEQERLDLLYLLTVADINGTSPKLWNGFKDRLLSDLHAATRYQLARGLEHPVHASERIAEAQSQALDTLVRDGVDVSAARSLWRGFPEESFLRHTPEQLAWMTRAVLAHPPDGAVAAVRRSPSGGTTEVLVHSPDREGLFATITAVLDRHALGVVDARVTNTRDARALDLFEVLEADGRPIAEALRERSLERALVEALSSPVLDLRTARRALSRRLRQFPLPTRLEFAADPSGRTQLALTCADRPGLLAHVAQALRACGVRVHGARIATFGARAEDVFVLSDASDAPLDEATIAKLDDAVRREIDGAVTTLATRPEGHHAHG